MAKTTKEMQPGVKYPGYGFINEYNEFQFTPSEVGSRKDVKKLVKEGNDFSVYHTKSKIIFHCSLDRKLQRNERIRRIIELMNEYIAVLQEYEI